MEGIRSAQAERAGKGIALAQESTGGMKGHCWGNGAVCLGQELPSPGEVPMSRSYLFHSDFCLGGQAVQHLFCFVLGIICGVGTSRL